MGGNAGGEELVEADQDQGFEGGLLGAQGLVQQLPGQGLEARQQAQGAVAQLLYQGTVPLLLQSGEPLQGLGEGPSLPEHGADQARRGGPGLGPGGGGMARLGSADGSTADGATAGLGTGNGGAARVPGTCDRLTANPTTASPCTLVRGIAGGGRARLGPRRVTGPRGTVRPGVRGVFSQGGRHPGDGR